MAVIKDNTTEYFKRQVIMSAEGDVDTAQFDFSQAVKQFYPAGTVVRVTRGNGSWVGIVRSVSTDRYAGYLVVEHGKSEKRHSIHWKDLKYS